MNIVWPTFEALGTLKPRNCWGTRFCDRKRQRRTVFFAKVLVGVWALSGLRQWKNGARKEREHKKI